MQVNLSLCDEDRVIILDPTQPILSQIALYLTPNLKVLYNGVFVNPSDTVLSLNIKPNDYLNVVGYKWLKQ